MKVGVAIPVLQPTTRKRRPRGPWLTQMLPDVGEHVREHLPVREDRLTHQPHVPVVRSCDDDGVVGSQSTLLAQVQRDLLEGKPLPDLLRKCILLGSQSGSKELRAWATRELRGYETEEELPTYRNVPAQIRADATTGNTWVTGQPIALSTLREFAREHITNQVPMFAGVGQLESLYESARTSDKNPQLALPGWEYIASEMDRLSGNPFQRIHSLYWVISPAVIAGVLDDVRTALTELLAELGEVMPEDQETPTADQATHALHVAVSGGAPQFNIAAPITSIQASGRSSIAGVSGGQTGVAGHDLMQTKVFTSAQKDAVTSWLKDYRDALPELDESIRPIAEQQLEQVAVEVTKDEPRPAVINGLLGSLKSFAQSAIAAAGAGAGTMGLAEVVAHWPIH